MERPSTSIDNDLLERRVAEVLAQRSSYDALPEEGQAIVRAEWAKRIDQGVAALDIAGELASAGRSWVELDEDGQPMERSRAHE